MNRIAKNTESYLKIKRSEFITNIKYVENIEKAKEFISEISEEHKTANHNCWAYVVGKKGNIFHSSDQGEPSGTAGKPMLRQLQSHNLTNIVAVVTRYFGGVKLGIRGLIEAYSSAVEQAVKESGLKRLIDYYYFSIQTDYSEFDKIRHYLEQLENVLFEEGFTTDVKFKIKVKENKLEETKNLLQKFKKNKILEFHHLSNKK